MSHPLYMLIDDRLRHATGIGLAETITTRRARCDVLDWVEDNFTGCRWCEIHRRHFEGSTCPDKSQSWRTIATDITDITEIAVTHETVRRWHTESS